MLARAFALNEKPDIYGPLTEALQRTIAWIAARETDVAMGVLRFQKQSRFEKEEVVYQGSALSAHLKTMGFEPATMEKLWQAYQEARAEDEAMQQGKDQADPAAVQGEATARPAATSMAIRVGAKTLGLVSRLIQILKLLFETSTDGPRDFRLVFSRTYIASQLGGRRAFQRSRYFPERGSLNVFGKGCVEVLFSGLAVAWNAKLCG